MAVSYYSLLDIPANASEDEIRRAYRKKAKELHPDVNKSPDAHNTFLLLHKAYETLINKDRRILYNQRDTRDPYTAYQEWIKQQQIKADYAAKIKFQQFLLKKERFRNSKLYYPALVGLYVATGFCYIFGTILISVCSYMIVQTHFMLIFFLTPFICGGVYFVKLTSNWFKKNKRYF